jgi:hypothetical protein
VTCLTNVNMLLKLDPIILVSYKLNSGLKMHMMYVSDYYACVTEMYFK